MKKFLYLLLFQSVLTSAMQASQQEKKELPFQEFEDKKEKLLKIYAKNITQRMAIYYAQNQQELEEAMRKIISENNESC